MGPPRGWRRTSIVHYQYHSHKHDDDGVFFFVLERVFLSTSRIGLSS